MLPVPAIQDSAGLEDLISKRGIFPPGTSGLKVEEKSWQEY